MKKPLKRSQAAEMACVCDRSINALIETDGFPKPIKIGKRDAWIDTEIQEWLDAKVAARDAVVGGAQ